MNEQLAKLVNEICSYLAEGSEWHLRAANQLRKNAIRGWGRWHDAEACGDFKCRQSLEKTLTDSLKFTPTINASGVSSAMQYTITGWGPDQFKQHHDAWMAREAKLITALNGAINEARAVNIGLYDELCCIQREVQNENMRVGMVKSRLDLAGYSGHDIGVCSKWLHDYFEKEYDGGCIDFNLG